MSTVGSVEEGSAGSVYLMVLPVSMFDVSSTRFAAESAFCDHLRELRRELGGSFTRLVVASPSMSAETYARSKGHLAELDLERDGISHITLFEDDLSVLGFWGGMGGLLPKLYRAVKGSEVVHAGISSNIKRPVEFTALLLAGMLGKRTIAVDDIDRRRSAWMNYQSGRWSLRPYLITRFIHDPLRGLQLHAVARFCTLVMLKGRKLCEDYGQGRDNVRYFLDAAFSVRDIIPEAALERKLATLRDPEAPLELTYFGRLTSYKGIDRCLRAVRVALDRGARRLRFHIIGAGEEEAALRRLSDELGLQEHVVFHGAVRFGPALFEKLHPCHVLLAAPLSEDTPRSALDAMASGISLLAFDTYYYKELAESGGVELVPWPNVEAMGESIARLCTDKSVLVQRARAALAFARQNTQEIWLARRMEWTRELLGDVMLPTGAPVLDVSSR